MKKPFVTLITVVFEKGNLHHALFQETARFLIYYFTSRRECTIKKLITTESDKVTTDNPLFFIFFFFDFLYVITFI